MMTKIVQILASLTLSLTLCATARASTITGQFVDVNGNSNTITIAFGLKNPTSNGTNATFRAMKQFTATNGFFSVVLVGGNYMMQVGAYPDSFSLSVPNDSTTYNWLSLVTNGITYPSTNTPSILTTGNWTYSGTNTFAGLVGNLFDSSGKLSLSPLTRQAFDVDGTSVTVDWTGKSLKNNNQLVLSWGSQQVLGNWTEYGALTIATNPISYPMPANNILFQIPDYGYIHLGSGAVSSGFNLWWNPAHSPDGEAQFTSYGRISLLAGYDQQNNAAIQIGAPGSAAANYVAANKQPASDADPLGNSLPLLFETQVRSNGNTMWTWPGMRAEKRLTNGAAGSTAIVFYLNTQQANGQFQDAVSNAALGTVAGLAVLDNGTEQHGKIVKDIFTVSPGSNYGINWDGTQTEEISLTAALTVTNVTSEYARANQSTTKHLRFYGGLSGFNITFPSGWNFYNDSGAVSAPTSIGGSQVLLVDVTQDIGSITNYSARSALASYSPYIDPDAGTFITNANISSGTQKFAVNNLVQNLKTHGTWTKLIAFYPCVGGTLQACTNDLKHTHGGVSNGSMTFVAGGMKGDGSSAYFDTLVQLSSSVTSYTNIMLGFTIQATNTTIANGSYPCGATDGGGGHGCSVTTDGVGMYPFGLDNNNVDNPAFPTGNNWTGVWVCNRTTSTAQILYQNYSNTRTSTTTAATGFPTGSVHLMFLAEGFNSSALSGTYSAVTENCMMVGQGFTDSDVSTITSDIQSFNTTLGR